MERAPNFSLRMEGRMDKHGKPNSGFSQLCEYMGTVQILATFNFFGNNSITVWLVTNNK
jgi:hypothetical protein